MPVDNLLPPPPKKEQGDELLPPPPQKKIADTTGKDGSIITPPISPSKSKYVAKERIELPKEKLKLQKPEEQFTPAPPQPAENLPAMTSKETEDIGKTLMAKVGESIPEEPQPSPEKKQEENYQIELVNIYEQARKTQQDIKILQERGDEAGAQQLMAQYDQLHQQSQDLLKKYPKALEMINQQKYADDLYSGKTGAALEFGAQFGNAILEGTKKLIEFAPRTAANITGNEESAGQYAADAVDEFFNNRKFLVSTDQFQKADGELNWSRIVPAIGQTAGTMLTLLGGAKAIGGSNASLFASSYMMTRNDYFDLAKEKGFTQAQSNAIADGSALLTSALELISPNPAIFTPAVKRQLLEEYAVQLAKSPKASFSNTLKTLATKEIIPENIQELAQNMGDKIVQAGADYMTGTENFDPKLFDKNEIMSTVALTTLTTGLISGGGVISQNKAARAQAIYELSKDPARTEQILTQQVQDGTITEQQATAVMNVVQKGAEAAAKVPDTIKDDKKAEATELVAEKTAIEQSIEGKDEALVAPQKQRIEEINNELTNIASEKPVEPTVEPVAKEPQPETGVSKEGVSQENVPAGEKVDVLENEVTNLVKEKGTLPGQWKFIGEALAGENPDMKQEAFKALKEQVRDVPEDVKRVLGEEIVNKIQTINEQEKNAPETETGVPDGQGTSEINLNKEVKNAVQERPATEKISRTGETGKNQPQDSGGVRQGEQGKELAPQSEEIKVEKNGKDETKAKGDEEALLMAQEDTGGEQPPVVELSEPEKTNLQSIEKETGDNFRLIQNTYNKYGEGKSLAEITAEDYQKAKDKREKLKESGRSKSYEEKRVPVSEEYNALVDKNKVSYKQMDLFDNAKKAVDYLSSFGEGAEGAKSAYDDLIPSFSNNPYQNPMNGVAAELLADKLFAEAELANKEGNQQEFNNLIEKSNNLRFAAFNAATVAGQYNAALAVFSRAVNPEAFLMFVKGKVQEVAEQPRNENTIKKITRKVIDTAEAINKAKKEAIEETLTTTPKREGRPSRLTALKERGLKRQNDALAKLKKLGFLGSSGLSNESIEAIGELILSQIELGVYNLAKITKRISALTNGKVREEHIKEAYEKYQASLDDKVVTLKEAAEQLQKEERADKLKKSPEKVIEKEVKSELKGKLSLQTLLKKNLEAGATIDAMQAELVSSMGFNESEAKNIATKYSEIYKKKLQEKIEETLRRELGLNTIKKVDQIQGMGEVKPFEKTLGGKITNQILAGALNTDTLKEAFSIKYGIPVITEEIANNIRLLSLRTKEATTPSTQMRANKELLSYIHQVMPIRKMSVLNTMYYISLLSGPSTAAVNLFANFNMLLNQRAENSITAIIELAQGEKGNLIKSPTGKKQLQAVLQNMWQGTIHTLDILQHGGGESKYYTLNQKGLNNFDAERLVAKKSDFKNLTLSKVAKTAAKLWYTVPTVITRNLDAFDIGFYTLNYNMEATREVRKKLYNKGLRGEELAAATLYTVYGTEDIQKKAIQDAIIETSKIGLDPTQNKKFVQRVAFEKIQQQLDDEVQRVSNEQAKDNVFKGKHRGLSGYIAHKIPQYTLITPFINTVMKIMEKNMNYIPLYGIARYAGFSVTDISRKLSPSIEAKFEQKGIEKVKREGEMRNKQLAQIVFSHALLITLYGLTKVGFDDDDDPKTPDVPLVDISGGYMGMTYKDKEKAVKLMPEYTIRIGNFSTNYESNPLLAMVCLPLSIGMDKERLKKESEPTLNAFEYAATALPLFMLNQTPLQNFADFFTTAKDALDPTSEQTPEEIGKWLVKNMAQIPANIVEPNTYKQAFDIADPKKYNAQTTTDLLWKAMNMENIGGLGVKYDWWGREVKFYPGETKFPFQYWASEGTDKIDRWIIEKDINVPVINLNKLVLSLDNKKSYTPKRWEQIQKSETEDRSELELTIDKQPRYRLLTDEEWQKMDRTVRQEAYKTVERNFNSVEDTWPDSGEPKYNEPFSKMGKKEADSVLRDLFKELRLDYINKNFADIEQE